MDREALRKALMAYQYEGISASLTYPALKKFWFQPVHRMVPAGIHANLITVLGGTCMVLSFLTCLLFTTYRNDSILILSGVLLWVYATFDNIDGTRARATGTSGPLGELLDHGVDTLIVYLTPLGIALCFGVAALPMFVMVSLGALASHASFWEVHRTSKLVTGRASDVDAFLASALLLVVAGVFGARIFMTPLLGSNWAAIDVLVGLTIAAFILQLFSVLFRMGLRNGWVLLPTWATQAALISWYWLSDGAVGILPLAMVLGLAAAYPNLKGIVAHLYRQPFPAVDWPTVVIAVGAPVGALVGGRIGLDPAYLVWTIVVALFVRHLALIAREARTIAGLLGVSVFHLPSNESESAASIS